MGLNALASDRVDERWEWPLSFSEQETSDSDDDNTNPNDDNGDNAVADDWDHARIMYLKGGTKR